MRALGQANTLPGNTACCCSSMCAGCPSHAWLIHKFARWHLMLCYGNCTCCMSCRSAHSGTQIVTQSRELSPTHLLALPLTHSSLDLSLVCTDNKQEGSPRGEGNQIEEAEHQGYNPLVPGRVVYIYRYNKLKHVHQVVVYIYRYNDLKHVHQIETRVVHLHRGTELKHKVVISDNSPQAD